jgi:tetratricopeptide (TPR) repeat protein
MDIWTVVGIVAAVFGIVAAVVGIPAAVVQVLQYLQERHGKEVEPDKETPPPPLPSVVQIPHNLPHRSEFIGREAEKARAHEALRSLRSRLISIEGIGGIGKTALALEVAYECLQASKAQSPISGRMVFEGYIWVTDEHRRLALNDLLDAIAKTLDYSGIVQQPLEDKRVSVQKLLQTKPYLLIVDNFETVTDDGIQNFLLNLPEPSKALITTREKKLTGVWAISLSKLERPEAVALIRSEGKRLGLAAVEHAEDELLDRLCLAAGGTPLAIKWALGQIKQRGQSLAMVLAALYEARGNIFQDMFARSWSLLEDEARQVLLVMPLFAAPATRHGIEAASGAYSLVLDNALGQLIEMSLVDVVDEPGLMDLRYGIHPLTRAFAEARLMDAPEFRATAIVRVRDYYTQFVRPVSWTSVDLPYWDGLVNYLGFDRVEREWINIAHTIRHTLEQHQYAAALDLFLPIVHFLHVVGLWDERVSLSLEMCRAAREIEDPVEAWLWIDAIGFIYRMRRQFTDCEQALDRGRTLAQRHRVDDALLLANVYEAGLHIHRKDAERAQKALGCALGQMDLDEILEHGTMLRRVVARRAARTAALLSGLNKDPGLETQWYERELQFRRSVGENPTPSLIALGAVHRRCGELSLAEDYLDQASAKAGPKDQAWLNYELAVVAMKRGRLPEARHLARLSLDQYRRHHHGTIGVSSCERLIGRIETELSKQQDRTFRAPETVSEQVDP